MSRLEELIAELCPDGVEYKPLRDVATVSRGGSFQKKDYIESGFPCIHYGQIYTTYGLFVNETVSFISEETAVKQKKAVTGDIITGDLHDLSSGFGGHDINKNDPRFHAQSYRDARDGELVKLYAGMDRW